MYKAVFIDVDGTLIRRDHSISTPTYEIIQRLKEKNILVVLVSARPLSGMLRIAAETGLLDHPLASLNGAYISFEGKIIFNSFIDPDYTSGVHALLRKYNETIIYYQQDLWYSEWQNFNTDHEQKITSVPVAIQPFNDTLQFWKDKNTGPNKILIIAGELIINEMQQSLKEQFNTQLNISTSKPTYLELMDKNASKRNTLELLLGRYKIDRADAIAIGDNFNDKEMIEFAGCGVAMGNAPDEVKAVANYVTDTNNNDGVFKAIKKLMDFQ